VSSGLGRTLLESPMYNCTTSGANHWRTFRWQVLSVLASEGNIFPTFTKTGSLLWTTNFRHYFVIQTCFESGINTWIGSNGSHFT
jgi:hypothetical protein